MTFVRVLACLRRDHPSDDPDQQLASIERNGDRVLVALDDGTTLEFDAHELAVAASVRPTRKARAA